jgi:hypothetical protein
MKPLILPICFLFFAPQLYSQNPTPLKILPNSTTTSVCPNNNTVHTVVAESGPRPACT